MPDPRLAAILRDTGLMDALRPPAQVQQQRALEQVLDLAGGINPEAARPLISPQVMQWGTRQRAARAGTTVLVAACADTPPSTGNCIVTVTMIPPGGGSVTIGTVQITRGMQTGEAQLSYPVPAGAWIGATVTTTNGAAGVSSSLVIKV